MLIYLDNCCYNRPFDGHEQLRVHIEALSKMQIQHEIMEGRHELVTSVVLDYESMKNRDRIAAAKIDDFMNRYSSRYVGNDEKNSLGPLRDEIMGTGIRYADATHLACAIHAKCDYFITTDDRVLKFKDDRIKVINPVDFISIKEE